MKKHSLAVITSFLLVAGIVAAQTAFIYPSFAEVHEPVSLPGGSWTWFIDRSLGGTLVDGTVRLLGVEEKRRTWREGSVTFYYAGGPAAQLAYLTRGLGYGLYYDLDTDSGRLVGWAKISNRLNQTLRFEKVTFIAGQVPLRSGAAPQMAMKKISRSMDVEAVGAPAPAPNYAGSGGGVYRYELQSPPPLEPGVTEIPFIRSSVEPVYTWSYRGGFYRGDKIEFNRGYTFAATAQLASGLVNLRSRGVLLGQALMPDTAKNGRVELWLGRDPEGKASRRIEVLRDERKEKSYRVTTTVRNPRGSQVKVDISESFSAAKLSLELPRGAQRTPSGYRYVFTLAAGAEKSFVYTVTLRY